MKKIGVAPPPPKALINEFSNHSERERERERERLELS